jgi:hypothetical protein
MKHLASDSHQEIDKESGSKIAARRDAKLVEKQH